jgi:general secretion pathway protein D
LVRLRFFTTATFVLILVTALVGSPAVAQDEPQALDRAIQLFEQGDYLASQELLLGIDRAKLTSKQQASRDDYLNRVQVAITMYEKALRDLEDAETAIAEGELDRAEHLLEGVLSNEYAAEAVRRSATAHLRDLKDREAPVSPPQAEAEPSQPPESTPPQPREERPPVPAPEGVEPPPVTPSGAEKARSLTQEGDEMLRAGRYDEAEQKYAAALSAVPGYPEAVEGLNRVRQHRENISGPRGQSLVERLREEDAINWQRTVIQYRDVERMIRQHLQAERFEEAQQLLVRARQIVEAGKQFADPVSKYESLRSELEALVGKVTADERIYNERKVAEIRRDIETQRSKKLREIEERRARQVDSLMLQAMQHRKDGEYEAAINILRQVIAMDPKNQPARWLMDILEDQWQYHDTRDTRDQFYKQSRGALQDVERAKVPWWQERTEYPENWLELINRPERRRPGQSGQDSLLLGALDRPIPVDFNHEPFHQVMERLADAQKVNIIVNWRDLESAGVVRDVPIDLSLPNEISLKKALTEVLDQAGAGAVELGYDVADGVITVATQRAVDLRTYPAVYPIADLLQEVPSFADAPSGDLRDVMREARRSDDRQPDLPWRYGDDDDNEPEEDPERADRVRKIIELIQDSIAPDSWRDRGGSIGTIKEINQQLVITQNSATQRQIGGLLDKLREQRAIQIAVEAIFLTVSSHYLEELGIDVDIVLNAGNAGFDFIDGGLGPAIDPVLGSTLLLPRTFSRLGFASNTPALGTALTAAPANVPQPYGQPYFVPQQTGGSGRQGTPIPIASGVTDLTNPANLPSDIPGSFAGQNIAPALSIFGSFLDNIQVDFLIRATQADSRTTVLTAPRIVVFNGGTAWVAVTVQQNFVSELTPVIAQAAVAQQPQTGTIDAGASLFVRATVTADRRYVILLIVPAISRLLDLQTFPFSGGTGALPAFIQLPTVSRQTLRTMVSVPDGGTLLIGGQKLASEAEIEAGVPILSKIPILKRLYSSRSMVKDEQTLLILIKPKILIHSEQEELAFPSFRQG